MVGFKKTTLNLCVYTHHILYHVVFIDHMAQVTCLYFGEDEMEVVLTQMETFCTGSGRASQLGCYVQTISWTNGVRDNENFQIMNGSFRLQVC